MGLENARDKIFGRTDLPSSEKLLKAGRARAAVIAVGTCPFLELPGITCEAELKDAAADAGRLMMHAQIGWRDPHATAENMREISARVQDAGGRVDRYGICLDWSMGYPADERAGRVMGTGLVLDGPDDFRLIASATNAAPHFGDFVLGMPAALENTEAALLAGATSIGNLGQYFTFRLPDWDDDVTITSETVKAIGLIAEQPVPILVHSNLDDGFAARFSDLACAFGAVLIERYIVEGLIGARVGHCFGHTFSDLKTRQAFHLALSGAGGGPGTMIYGNTTAFTANAAESYAALAAYLSADIQALRWAHTGHALTPIPVTEAIRIPSVDEIVEAQLFAQRLVERQATLADSAPPDDVLSLSRAIGEGGEAFFGRVIKGMEELGYNVRDPVEMMLALRRIGAAELERAFGPGAPDDDAYYGRRPVVAASVIDEIDQQASRIVANLPDQVRVKLVEYAPRVCVATTDVHEYGKRLVERVLRLLDVPVIDGGISVDADDLMAAAVSTAADAIAVSTYNGVAKAYAEMLLEEKELHGADMQLFIGGRLNAVPDGSNTNLPVDVAAELAGTEITVCAGVEDMLLALVEAKGDT